MTRRRKSPFPENARCCACGRGAVDGVKFNKHHIVYRSNGGSNACENLEVRCTECHIRYHSTRGDFKRWGTIGGTARARNPYCLRNLRQFRVMTDAEFEAYVAARYLVTVEPSALVFA